MLTIREKLTYLTYLNTHSSRQDEPFQYTNHHTISSFGINTKFAKKIEIFIMISNDVITH